MAKMKLNKGMFKKAAQEAKASGFASFDDGIYMVCLTQAEISESMSSGRLQVNRAWTIAEGDQEGENIRDYPGIDNEQQLTFFNRDLIRLGYEPPASAEELEELLEQMIKDRPLVRIRLVTKNSNGIDYQNIQILKVLEPVTAGEEDEEEEELPFDEDDDDDDDDDDESSESEESSDDDDDDDDDDWEEISVGDNVWTVVKGKTVEGVVTGTDKKTGKLIIKPEEGRSIKKKPDQVELVDE
jgi:hypothetical protein